MGEDHAARQRLAPQTANPSLLAASALRRHTPEVGAVCGNPARTDLCGGRSAMSVPTANRQEIGGIGHDYLLRRKQCGALNYARHSVIACARREADQVPKHSPLDDRHRPAPELSDSRPEPDADRPKPATPTRTTPLAPTPPLAW
jgi:hypothetical protein